MDLGKAVKCPVFPKVTRVEVARGFKFNDLHNFFPSLEVLKFTQATGAILVLEDGDWLDCQKLPVGREVIVYTYNLSDEVSNPSQQMTNLSHHLAFVTLDDDTFDLAIFRDCVNLKQLNLVWNGINDLQVDGLAAAWYITNSRHRDASQSICLNMCSLLALYPMHSMCCASNSKFAMLLSQAELPISVAVFLGLSWVFVDDLREL